MADHRWSSDPGSDRDHHTERSIAELDLGRWDQVRHLLLARLVPRHRAGPLAFEPPLAPGLGQASVRFDVGIDVAGGIVRLDRGLISSMAVPTAEIWRAALTNLAGQDHPPRLAVPDGPGPLVVVAGGPWTTGLLLVPEQLDLATSSAPSPGSSRHPARRPARPDRAIVAVAPHPEVLVLGRVTTGAGPEGRDDPSPDAVGRAVLALAAALAEADGGPRLPLVQLQPVRSMQEVLSRAGGFWNDVPVSEQPGLR